MNESLSNRVRAAAVAGWWTVLIVAVVMTVQWFVLLAIMSAEPGWLLRLWGGGELDWPRVQTILIYFFAVFKLILFTFVIIALWLTLWSRRLKRVG